MNIHLKQWKKTEENERGIIEAAVKQIILENESKKGTKASMDQYIYIYIYKAYPIHAKYTYATKKILKLIEKIYIE